MEIADAMDSLPERIMEYGEARPEATPIQADDLLYLGDRGGRRTGAVPTHPLGAALADLPGRLHASDPDAL